MKVALFGGNGYLGSQLAAYYAAKGVSCDIFDVPTFDVTCAKSWDSFKPVAYSAILFFAGLTGTEMSFAKAERFLEVNEHGLLNLLVRLTPFGERAPKVIFPSTRLVYKGADIPLPEDAPKEAKTVYAASKLACEYLLQAYHVRYGIPYAVLRICVPYGNIVSHDYSFGTIGAFIRQLKESGVISLYGGGVQKRTFTSVRDICRTVCQLCEAEATGVFNIGGEAMSLHDAACVIARKMGGSVRTIPWPEAALAIESGSTVFEDSRLKAALGFEVEWERMSEVIGCLPQASAEEEHASTGDNGRMRR